jgi:hypothetical protein
MGTSSGPKIVYDNLILYLDADNKKSSIRKKQTSNLLVDPNTWTIGNGSTTGYSANGSTTEQNRVYVIDDPWGGRSVTWRTTPDSVSGADGGWNSTYYSINRTFTYRWVVWVRRYTTGTGGTFYFGMNPAPLRNDNSSAQSNPYFTYLAISSLTYNQWYMIVGHCFYEGYTGGRHPDSGWYENGVKILDKSYGNVGNQDVRWQSSTTSSMHRTYHYYTTNTSSGIEFAYPRLDKCDGSEPTIKDLLEIGESSWVDLTENNNIDYLDGNIEYDGTFIFDGIDDYIQTTLTGTYSQMTFEFWGYFDDNTLNTKSRNESAFGDWNSSRIHFGTRWSVGMHWNVNSSWTEIPSTNLKYGWNHYCLVWDNTSNQKLVYLNSILSSSNTTNGNITLGDFKIGVATNLNYYYRGKISNFKIYDKPLEFEQIFKNFNSMKNKFGL